MVYSVNGFVFFLSLDVRVVDNDCVLWFNWEVAITNGTAEVLRSN